MSTTVLNSTLKSVALPSVTFIKSSPWDIASYCNCTTDLETPVANMLRKPLLLTWVFTWSYSGLSSVSSFSGFVNMYVTFSYWNICGQFFLLGLNYVFLAALELTEIAWLCLPSTEIKGTQISCLAGRYLESMGSNDIQILAVLSDLLGFEKF